jgi:hypothetical protein
LPQPSDNVVVIHPGWSGVEGPPQDLNLSELQWGNPKETIVEEEQEQNQAVECSLRVRRGIGGEIADSEVPTSWCSTWAQAQAGAQYIRDMEERFGWMKEADKGMLNLGFEPYPWDQFAEAIERTGETEFQAIEQRGNGVDVFRENCPEGGELVVGATLVIRSRTIVTAMNVISDSEEASPATAKLLTQMAESLPVGAQVDLIVATDATLATLGTCADILTHGWDIDQSCQEPNWKNLMETWRNKQLHASCRMEDAEGVDSENIPFLTLAIQEVRQTVSDAIQSLMEGLDGSGQ